MLFFQSYNKISEASPKKLKKPKTSVAVVSRTVEPTAGSIFIRFNINGINAPVAPAMRRLMIIAKPMTRPSLGILNQK